MHNFEMKKIKNFLGRGIAPFSRPLTRWGGGLPLPKRPPLGASILAPSALDPDCFFDKLNTCSVWYKKCRIMGLLGSEGV